MNCENYSNVSSKPVIPVILGPTASGKSAHAIEFAKRFNAEIVSADSMQIYKEMNIGTAKPSEEERKQAIHHLVDMIEPDTEFSVADYRRLAYAALDEILARGKIPVVCGGTGLYINALMKPVSLDYQTTDESVRKELEDLSQRDPEKLYAMLKEADSVSAEKIHPNNLKRIIRALEIFQVSGIPKSELDRRAAEGEVPYRFQLFMPMMEREQLYARIDRRVDLMLEEGLLDEAKMLLEKYDKELTSMQAIGYKELYDYLEGRMDLSEAVRILKRDTRHYAKRQLTWFRQYPDILPVEEIFKIDWNRNESGNF